MESGKLFIHITQKENNFPNNHPLGSHKFLQTISYRNNGNIKVKMLCKCYHLWSAPCFSAITICSQSRHENEGYSKANALFTGRR